eukprot:588450-Lingulodinium_polyedra.AAC.1
MARGRARFPIPHRPRDSHTRNNLLNELTTLTGAPKSLRSLNSCIESLSEVVLELMAWNTELSDSLRQTCVSPTQT